MLPALKNITNIISFLIIITFFLLFVISPQVSSVAIAASNNSGGQVEGAATLGIANLVSTNLNVQKVPDGSILSNAQKGAILSVVPYDPQVLGIVSRDAAILISTGNSGSNSLPVISDGTVYVLVSTQQGSIAKGDFLTTSTIPGVAVKAVDSGYVLGTALESYSNSNPKQTELMAVDLNLHYFNTKPTLLGSLSDILKFAFLPTANSPTAIFKYTVAALVVLASLILAFMTFGRTAAKGVEALGRNPAASRIIHLGIILNVVIVVVIVLAGLTVAFMILRL